MPMWLTSFCANVYWNVPLQQSHPTLSKVILQIAVTGILHYDIEWTICISGGKASSSVQIITHSTL